MPLYRLVATILPQCETCSANAVGHPIDPSTGAVYTREQDVTFATGSPIDYERYYNSADQTGIDGVPGWRHSYGRSISTLYQAPSTLYPGASASVSPQYTTPSQACLTGFATIQSSVSAWASASVSYNDGVCVLSHAGLLIGTVVIQSNPVPEPPATPVEYDLIRDDGQILRFTLQNGIINTPPGISIRLGTTASGFTVTDDQDNVETYNTAGVLQSITSRAGVVQTLSYTGGLWSGVTDSFGNGLTVTRNAQSNIATVSVTGGGSVEYMYDSASRLSLVTHTDSTTTSYVYGDGRFVTALTAEIDESGTIFATYTHNGFDDVTQIVSPDTGTTAKNYNSGGLIHEVTDARGMSGFYDFDALNRVTQIAYQDQSTKFTYDQGTNGIGRLTSAADQFNTMSWTYDTHGRVTGKSQGNYTIVKAVGYAYSNDDLVSLVTPSGQTITYGYTNHRITSVAINGAPLLSGVLYEPFGAVSTWTWADGDSAGLTHNTDGNAATVHTGDLLNLSYDNATRVSGITDSSNSALNWSLGYDSRDHLTSASKSGTTYGWTFDANGNRLTQTGTYPTTFTVSPTSNELSATTGNLSRSYAYDAAGNALSFGGMTFTYDDRDRMSSATVGSTVTKYYRNSLGQLFEKSVGGTGTFLFYDEAGHLLGEYTANGSLIQETVWMGDTPVATLRPNGSSVAFYYVQADQLNVPRSVSRSSDHRPVWTWNPDPYGNTAPNQNPYGFGTFIYNLRFPGQYYQAETGLNYNYSRDYDPQTGRYVESDPIGLLGGINTYAYALDNPVSWRDPSGLDITITITRQGVSSTGLSIPGTINVTSTLTPLSSINASTIENAEAGDNGGKPPIPAGSYPAYIRTDHDPNRIELQNVPGYSNIQIHPGSYPRNFKGCFGAGTAPSLDFLGGTVATQNKILSLIAADGSGNITVNVGPLPLGPVLPESPGPFGLSFP